MRVLDSIDEPALDELCARHEFFWLDLVGPTDEQLDALARRFGWHEIALRDAKERRQRPKLNRYDDQMLIVFYGVRVGGREAAELSEVHMMVSGDWVVTVRWQPSPELDDLHARLASPGGAESEQFVVYRILDTLTDSFFPVLERIDNAIDELEDTIVVQASNEQLQHVFQLRRQLAMLRRVVLPQRDLAARTIDDIAELPGLDPGTRDYFRDVYDHLIRVADQIDSYRDLLTSAVDVYLSTTSNRLNDVMRRLTLVSTIFLPIAALTGFFGQNFGWLVRHIDTLGAFLGFGVGGLLVAVVLLVTWFKRAHFLD